MENMTLNTSPGYTNLIIRIAREKITEDYNPTGAVDFIREIFHVDENTCIRVICGDMIPVFEGLSGYICRRTEVPVDYVEDAGGLPAIWDTDTVAAMLREKLGINYGYMVELLEASPVLRSLNREYQIDMSGMSDELDLPGWLDWDVVATGTGYDIVRVYAGKDTDSDARDLIARILESDSDAVRLVSLMQEVDKKMDRMVALGNMISWMRTHIGVTTDMLDESNANYSRYLEKVCELRTLYNIIHDGAVTRRMKEEAEEAEGKFNKFIECERNREITGGKFTPANITDEKWDAGWISPEGDVFAEMGEVSNFIHINLAPKILEYKGIEAAANPDHTLEELGYVKFHHNEITFTGYGRVGMNRRHITTRQIDRLHDYAMLMDYMRFKCNLDGYAEVSELYNYSDEEWEDLFS